MFIHHSSGKRQICRMKVSFQVSLRLESWATSDYPCPVVGALLTAAQGGSTAHLCDHGLMCSSWVSFMSIVLAK